MRRLTDGDLDILRELEADARSYAEADERWLDAVEQCNDHLYTAVESDAGLSLDFCDDPETNPEYPW